ncbi:MAG TPA: 2-succinyl-5-enolpyruvyl-6-hydroxy-3-cyclohexene-1-carboxylic-acid synthase [Pseudonocardiaceae bacterium]|nr:2-succinyl-5-enolpyruvyl-6-hydroxy-3-cyclohexene-1-carboxylic-acid synthase [Pseudonocardiaceae bacterium]
MNPSTALARVLVDELVRCGVRDAVLCPGSRNAPLSFALHEADAERRLRLHVRIDERSAAFLALGLALGSGVPVPVVCTSGTAAANLHPAVLEAHQAGVPLLAVTADRPPELIGVGANQTVQQRGLFGAAVRDARVLATTACGPGQDARWRSTVDRVVAAARGALGGWPGPVHVDVPLAEPLVPGADGCPEPSAGRGGPWTMLPAAARPVLPVEVDLGRRTLVVAGHGAGPAPAGLPLVAEPTAACWPDALTAGPWLLGAGVLQPEQVVVLGRPTLHRPVARLLADPDVAVTVVTADPQWTDVAGTASAVGTRLDAVGDPDPAWLAAWRAADLAAAGAVRTTVDVHSAATGLHVARDVVAALPAGAVLVVGSSNPIRDVALAARPRPGLTVLSNRGVAGIDGTVSTAVGAALARHDPADQDSRVPDGASFALLGDLTFLHDANGLLIGPGEPRPDLTIVVANDDGGGIFGLLEQGGPEHSAAFDRVFGTPHGTDLAALCAAHHVEHVRASLADLPASLAPRPGLRVVEVRTERADLRALHTRIRDGVTRALGG